VNDLPAHRVIRAVAKYGGWLLVRHEYASRFVADSEQLFADVREAGREQRLPVIQVALAEAFEAGREAERVYAQQAAKAEADGKLAAARRLLTAALNAL
jgi:hypothetical protein